MIRPALRGIALLPALAATGAVAAPNAAQAALRQAPYEAAVAGIVLDSRLAEISGLAVSRRHDGVLWVHNDSDGGATLYALAADGTVLGRTTIEGAPTQDWEDLAAWTDAEGTPRLLIADVGDNGGLRSEFALIVIDEPADPGATTTTAPRYVIRARWPDGPRDCEAVAVDGAAGEVLLAAKKRVPGQLFRIALAPPASAEEVRTAEQIATVPGIPQPSAEELAAEPVSGRWRAQITAMDLAPDGRRLALLTYRDGYLYTRAERESWRDALLRDPERLGMLALPQAEALAFDRHGTTIWIGTERLPAPLLRLSPRR